MDSHRFPFDKIEILCYKKINNKQKGTIMKIVSPSVQILTPLDGEQILRHIENCGRTCYQSYENKNEESHKKMIAMLIKSGHESVLEHFSISVKLLCDVGCYDDKTHILTENGWKLFKDVKADEKVFTKTDNGKVCLYPITCIIEKPYKGLLHSYHSSQVNLRVTPDHNMWVFDNHKRSAKTKIWKFLESQNLTNKSYSFDKSGNKERNDCNRVIAIPATTRQCGIGKREFNGHTFDNLAFFEFLGWWATDGCLEKHGNHFIISLSQFKTKGVQRIEYLLNKLNLDYSEYKGRYRIKSPALADFISKEFYQDEEDCSKSLDFKITPLIRNAYTNEIEAFLQGVLGGDGTEYKDGRKIIYTASKQFALDLIELCFRCGKTANYYMANYEKQYASSPFNHNVPVYVVSICRTEKTWFDKIEKNYSEEEYDGKVYCVSLDKHHRLFVMREGKTCWCGNCYKDITRHRAGTAFSIESTRFCDYNKGKFGGEIKFIQPVNIQEGTDEYIVWQNCLKNIEDSYKEMAELGCKPDQLRMILPHSTAAEVCMTANLRAWRHIFKMRCAKAAHPSVQQIMKMVLKEFHDKIPVVFDDLYNEFLGK